MIEPSVHAVLEACGARVRAARPVSGGDVNRAYRVELTDGRSVFVKTHDRAPADLFTKEAEGLAWLAEACALRTPRVLAVSSDALALEWVDAAPPAADYEEALGRGLAMLHRAGSERFGLLHDNYIGSIPQSNEPASDWAAFYRVRRLEPLFRRASPRFDARARGAFDRLLSRLPELVGRDEPPARLHGDLWSGNVICDERGQPVLIDPAVYGGHREMDLAMMRLFGRFSARSLAAYEEVLPPSDGHEGRVALHQLYPLLVHVCLFGAGYVPSVLRVLDAYAV